MNTTGKLDSTAAASGGILSRERIIAKKGFNRWLVPPAALAIHLCIGMAYGSSVFWLPLSRAVGTATGTKVPSCAGAATTFRALLFVQHWWQVFLGNASRFDRPHDGIFCLLLPRHILL